MSVALEKYKNIDKSAHTIFDESDTFKVLHLKNSNDENVYYQFDLNHNYLQLYFSLNNDSIVAFNMEHCAIELTANEASMVYFKDEEMKVLLNLSPKNEIILILISIDYFHSLFSKDGNYLFNFSSFKIGQPIIESREISPTLSLILNQLLSKQITDALRPIYVKGKIYELLSHYYSKATQNENDNCPYVANEETISKIKRAKEIILKEMNNPPSLPELAKMVGLNIKKLKTDFKEFYGVPVFTFLLNYKMEHAKTLLQDNKMNVNEIAHYLGYTTSSHFIAAFKRKFGITPKQFSKS